MPDTAHDFTAHWSTRSPARSPLLMLGGSVVAAVMLIGTGLSMLGTEAAVSASGGSGAAQRLSSASQRPAVATLAADELKTIQVASAGPR